MSYFDKIVKRIRILEKEKRLPDGSLLIGQASHIAPHAWVHGLYPCLSVSEIENLDGKIRTEIPVTYRNFLLEHSNGLSLFSCTLNLYGLRKRNGRKIEDAWQPYSIIDLNTIERIENAAANHFFIGSYNWDGSLLYIDTVTNEVLRCSRESVASLNVWPNFEEMILSEVERIALLFDENGVEKDKDHPSVP